jgi:hypothetical protein
MSVIVRDEDGQILLLCKGADRLGQQLSLTWSFLIFSNRLLKHPEPSPVALIGNLGEKRSNLLHCNAFSCLNYAV